MVAPWGDIIRSANAPTNAGGIGGDVNTIWFCYGGTADRVGEYSTVDLSAIRSQVSPESDPNGIGGNAGTIWHCDGANGRLYELDPSDFSIIHIQIEHGTNPSGIGGDSNYIWHCDNGVDEVYELNTNLSIISDASSPGTDPAGIGGKYNKIWHVDDNGERLYELASDLSVIRNKSIYKYLDIIRGVGGDSNAMWSCSAYNSKIYERSVGTPVSYLISGNVKDHDGNNLDAVSLEIKNGTDYSTLTNINGNYLQTISPDIYTVTASKYGYASESATVDASSSDQVQNFILLKPVISGNVKDSNGINLSNATISLDNSLSYETTTDVDGNYSQEVEGDVYLVTASKNKYLDSSASVDATVSNQTQNFVLPIPVISGNVKDSKGYNVDGVVITFTDDTSYETTTDSDGNYSQEVYADEYTVEASLIGYVPDSADVDASLSNQTQDFILGRATAPHDKGIYLGDRFLINDLRP